jgi:hypothetical protein
MPWDKSGKLASLRSFSSPRHIVLPLDRHKQRVIARGMKRLWPILLLLLTGCSTAPLADFLDFVRPGRLGPERVAPYGGVNAPRQVGAPIGSVALESPPAPPR